MSYAIIRNTKYKRDNLKGIFRHNERRNKNYSNDNIDKEAKLIKSATSDKALTLPKETKDEIRAKIFKNMLINLV